MGLWDDLKRKAQKRAADAAKERAKERFKDAAQKTSKALGDLFFGEEKEGTPASKGGDVPGGAEAEKASRTWEEAKARIVAREAEEKARREAAVAERARQERSIDAELREMKEKLRKK